MSSQPRQTTLVEMQANAITFVGVDTNDEDVAHGLGLTQRICSVQSGQGR